MNRKKRTTWEKIVATIHSEEDGPLVRQKLATTKILQKSLKFWVWFDQLGLRPEARTAEMEMLLDLAAQDKPHCYAGDTTVHGSLLEPINSIVFSDEDMEAPYTDHQRPLYLEGTINDVHVRRALVDTGSSINVIPMSVITAADISKKRIIQANV